MHFCMASVYLGALCVDFYVASACLGGHFVYFLHGDRTSGEHFVCVFIRYLHVWGALCIHL